MKDDREQLRPPTTLRAASNGPFLRVNPGTSS
jgi:hypothetical protein